MYPQSRQESVKFIAKPITPVFDQMNDVYAAANVGEARFVRWMHDSFEFARWSSLPMSAVLVYIKKMSHLDSSGAETCADYISSCTCCCDGGRPLLTYRR